MRFLLCRRFRTPRATFGQQRMGYYPRRYNTDYIPQNIIRRKSMHTFKNPEDRWGTPEDLKALGIPSEHTVISPDSGANPSSRPSPRRRLRPLEPRRPSRNPKTTSVRSRTSPKRSHRKHSRHPARRLRPGRLVPAPLGLLAGIRLAGLFAPFRSKRGRVCAAHDASQGRAFLRQVRRRAQLTGHRPPPAERRGSRRWAP